MRQNVCQNCGVVVRDGSVIQDVSFICESCQKLLERPKKIKQTIGVVLLTFIFFGVVWNMNVFQYVFFARIQSNFELGMKLDETIKLLHESEIQGETIRYQVLQITPELEESCTTRIAEGFPDKNLKKIKQRKIAFFSCYYHDVSEEIFREIISEYSLEKYSEFGVRILAIIPAPLHLHSSFDIEMNKSGEIVNVTSVETW